MSNNNDIRCGLLMKIELNRNYVEEMLNENWNYDFSNESYLDDGSEECKNRINAFWTELNEKCVHIFDFEAHYLLDSDDLLYEAIRDKVDMLADDYGFNFNSKTTYAITEWNDDGTYETEAINNFVDNQEVEEGIEDGTLFEGMNGDIIINEEPDKNCKNYFKEVEKTPYQTISLNAYAIRSSGWINDYFDAKTLYDLDNDEMYEMYLYSPKEEFNLREDINLRRYMTEKYWSIEGVNKEDEVFYTRYNTSSIVALWFCNQHYEDVEEEEEEEEPIEEVREEREVLLLENYNYSKISIKKYFELLDMFDIRLKINGTSIKNPRYKLDSRKRFACETLIEKVNGLDGDEFQRWVDILKPYIL